MIKNSNMLKHLPSSFGLPHSSDIFTQQDARHLTLSPSFVSPPLLPPYAVVPQHCRRRRHNTCRHEPVDVASRRRTLPCTTHATTELEQALRIHQPCRHEPVGPRRRTLSRTIHVTTEHAGN